MYIPEHAKILPSKYSIIRLEYLPAHCLILSPTMANLKQTIALVTGGNKGIGRAIATSLARDHNYTVLIGSRSLPAGEEVASSLTAQGHSAHAIQLDVTSDTSILVAVDLIKDKFGRLDVLVNNAGIYLDAYKPGVEVLPTRELFSRTFETNLFGPAVLSNALLPLLAQSTEEKTGPRVVWVSSSMSSMARATDKAVAYYYLNATSYVCSKASVNMLALQYGKDLERVCGEGKGRSLVVCPGLLRSDLNGQWEAAERGPEDGARWVVRVAADAEGEVENGTFTDENGVVPW
jgi:NAD(P)-dependent dehydrogenase (short-subunit alcohol dehydrogenase family)